MNFVVLSFLLKVFHRDFVNIRALYKLGRVVNIFSNKNILFLIQIFL